VRGDVMTFDLKKVIMDDILWDDHVNLTIFYCLKMMHPQAF
jgi:hypothetical protein